MSELVWSKDKRGAFAPFGYGDRILLTLMLGKQEAGLLIYNSKLGEYTAELFDRYSNGLLSGRCLGRFSVPSDAMVALEKHVRSELPDAVTCERCGKIELPWCRHDFDRPKLCSRCGSWLKSLDERKQKPECFIAKGEAYQICPEFPRGDGGMRGFGGRPYLVLFDDGREVFTTNLYTQGEIPECLHYLARDTAELRCLEFKERTTFSEIPRCTCSALPFPHVCLPKKTRPADV